MMFKAISVAVLALFGTESALAAAPSRPIDRQALVTRHNVVITALDEKAPLQVGNGQFAFGADVTGLQTFVPFSTMSHWGWHSMPLPQGQRPEEFRGQVWDTHGRPVRYAIANPQQPALSHWLAANPHRLNLGRIGLLLIKPDGRPAAPADLRNPRQELDLWQGVISSSFQFDGQPVRVRTCCHPRLDAVAVRIESPLIALGRLRVAIDFPYGDDRERPAYVGDWNNPGRHETKMTPRGPQRADFERKLDADGYHVALAWETGATLRGSRPESPHHFELSGAGDRPLAFVAAFSPSPLPQELPGVKATFLASRRHWPEFWNSGGAIDLSASKDRRWRELERRIVLSQYLLAVNEAGSLPPQESGLVNNGWYGRFHFEMYWWHAAHYALWDRWPLLNRSLDVYRRFLASARQRANEQGYRGARWPKCTGPDGREWPHPIHALLVWQQPHPIFFAELDYRAHPSRATLEKWRDVVFDTADFLTSYAWRDEETGRYVLGPPLFVVSENTKPKTTRNPAFELGYWRFGLRTAQTWRERLGMGRSAEWDKVLGNLSPLPVEDGLYVLHEGVRNMWSKWNWEHPALIGTFGMLPGDGVDRAIIERTFNQVLRCWNFQHTWGWDFPMLAMCGARVGEPGKAVDMLLHPAGGCQFDERGLAAGGPFPYFPANGGLLYAVAMMAAGWDGGPAGNAPGFPGDGTWTVRWEGLKRAP
jgi:hypothetical protein